MLRLVLCALVLSACAAPAADAGLEPALRRHLATVEPDAPVDVLVGLGETAPPTATEALSDLGLEVRAVAGEVVIARGLGDAIRRAAALSWVERVALSQERPPLTEPAR